MSDRNFRHAPLVLCAVRGGARLDYALAERGLRGLPPRPPGISSRLLLLLWPAFGLDRGRGSYSPTNSIGLSGLYDRGSAGGPRLGSKLAPSGSLARPAGTRPRTLAPQLLTRLRMNRLAELDHQFVWHPF